MLGGGGRLLAVGNGGSACQAQHLTSELVGRYRDDRAPFSALALCTETSALTAIGNDYGIEHLFARQVRGHGRAGRRARRAVDVRQLPQRARRGRGGARRRD